MVRADNLWLPMISDGNIDGAVEEVNSTHHWHNHHTPNKCTAWVEETRPERIKDLRQTMIDGFVQAPFKVKPRYDPSAEKWRDTNEPQQYPDQYIHHAVIRALMPVMMRGMDKYCCGSIRGRGSEHGRGSISGWMQHDPKGTKYCLQCDIRQFYPSLKPEVVMDRMRHLVKDARVLDIIWRIVKDGVKIGAFPSQWFANTTLQPLDHLIREGGYGVTHYLRNMDNFTIFSSNKRKLRKLRAVIEAWLNERGLQLKDDWQIFQTGRDIPNKAPRHQRGRRPSAVGYRYGHGYTIPRKRNLLRMKRQASRYRKRRDSGKRISVKMAAGLISRIGQLKHCNNHNLYRLVLQGERLQRELKNIIRANARRREYLTWSTFLEQRARSRSLKPRAANTPA